MIMIVEMGVVAVVEGKSLVEVDNLEVVEVVMGVVEVPALVCITLVKELVITVASLGMCQVTVGTRVAFVVEPITKCKTASGTLGPRTIRVPCLLVLC
jgi:hypothetical protein